MSGRSFYLAPVDRTDAANAMAFVLHPGGDRPVEAELIDETEHTVVLAADGEALAGASPTPGVEVLVALPDGRWLLGAAGAPHPSVLTVRLVAAVADR
jgi:hypothetical protein